MNTLPTAVEATLLDAGFSPTEILIIRRLMTDEALSLREIASRTGKSTGVLDQAMTKLLRKNIIKKEMINDSGKFVLTSLDAVLKWIEDDVRKKHDMLARQHQNFESFINSFEKDKKRPDIQFFEGLDGIACAYRKMLDCGKEMLCYVPVFCSIEDHPLRDFMVEWFRMRRKAGVFSRVISHDTPLGRRYQSRDPFEYRQTLLIDEKQYPFNFEKIICGDWVACFNYVEKRACILKYPELVAMERAMFEGLWQQPNIAKDPVAVPAVPKERPVHPEPIPLSVRTFSGLREFFLSRNSIAAFVGIAVLSAVITFGLYQYTKRLEFQRIKDTVQSVASTGTFQFDAKDLDALRVEQDWKKPEWSKVVKQMEQIRKNNKEITFVYLVRKTEKDPAKMEFIADSHSIDPYVNVDNDPYNDIDANGDGKIEPQGPDLLQWPGQEYSSAPEEAFLGYEKPVTNEEFYEDTWGKYVSGYAPIKDADGRVAGVIAVDMRAALLDERIASVFKPIIYFVALFLLFVFIRLAAFNKSLFTELWNALRMKEVLQLIALGSAITFCVLLSMYYYTLRQTINEVGNRIMSVVATAAPEFDAKDLDRLHVAEDMKTDNYQRIFNKLNQIRSVNTEFKYVYINRLVDSQDNSFEFVADADSNYNLAKIGPDFNNDGHLDEADENPYPGTPRHSSNNNVVLRQALSVPTFEPKPYTDQWGMWISGYAPIRNSHGIAVAVLAADIDVANVKETVLRRFLPWLWIIGTIVTISLGLFAYSFWRPSFWRPSKFLSK